MSPVRHRRARLGRTETTCATTLLIGWNNSAVSTLPVRPQLRQIDQQAAALRDALLRISGAIQVLDELLAQPADNPSGSVDSFAPVTLHGP